MILCDIAVPGDVAPEVADQRPDVLILEGGAVEHPARIFNRRSAVAAWEDLRLPGGNSSWAWKASADTAPTARSLRPGAGKALAPRKHGFRFSQLVSIPTL